MSNITILWSMVGAFSLLLGVMYGLVWVMDRRASAHLAFACEALAIAGTVVIELHLMRATTAAEWGELVRWSQIPLCVRFISTVIFIRLYFGTGRLPLIWAVVALRVGILITGFVVDPNFNYSRIDSIEHIQFLGETVAVVGRAVPSGWQWIATLSTVCVLVFVLDASIQLWRQNTAAGRRRALVIGGATLLSTAIGIFYTQLMILGGLRVPVLLSLPYLIMLAAMAVEVSRDTLAASRLARELRDSEARLEVAASAAGLGLWTWDSEKSMFWSTNAAKSLLGLAPGERVDFERLRAMMDPDDLSRIEDVWRAAAASGVEAEIQFRIRLPDGSTRLLAGRGRSQADGSGKLTNIQGVLRDITEQDRARQENEELRREIAHAGRVSMLGTLSSSLAHELSQPLGAILMNAETAKELLKRPDANLEEVRHILDEIHRDDRRAAEVIEGLRNLLKRRKIDLVPVSIESIIDDVHTLVKSDAAVRGVKLLCSCEPGVGEINGDKVHLTQLLLNLVMNAMDAVGERPELARRVAVLASTGESGTVNITVEDSGAGIPPEELAKVFDPFFTTKPNGMGMGLSISRTIVEAHGGRIECRNGAHGGATFLVSLPAHSG